MASGTDKDHAGLRCARRGSQCHIVLRTEERGDGQRGRGKHERRTVMGRIVGSDRPLNHLGHVRPVVDADLSIVNHPRNLCHGPIGRTFHHGVLSSDVGNRYD